MVIIFFGQTPTHIPKGPSSCSFVFAKCKASAYSLIYLT
uniref:Uncharacterized protein n=1 Tax=Arundo donax TaxID=35708 RepID=A0A0A9T145_ARUDO